jgi:hypothetical protein
MRSITSPHCLACGRDGRMISTPLTASVRRLSLRQCAQAKSGDYCTALPNRSSFRRTLREPFVTEEVRTTIDEMPGAYTRSKLAAEQFALEAAASGLPVVIANPTMPIGVSRSLTPPALMLQYFARRWPDRPTVRSRRRKSFLEKASRTHRTDQREQGSAHPRFCRNSPVCCRDGRVCGQSTDS